MTRTPSSTREAFVWTVSADRGGVLAEPKVVTPPRPVERLQVYVRGPWLRFYREADRIETEVIARDAKQAAEIMKARHAFVKRNRLWGKTIKARPTGYRSAAESA